VHDYSVALTETFDAKLREHLIREDGEEDLLFTLYTPSQGQTRDSALLHTPLFPEPGDRQRHGNVSFNRSYLERACREALRQGYGVAFLHSHPIPGWQGMSDDDVRAEARTARTVEAVTGLPLVGLTVGSDGTWSALTESALNVGGARVSVWSVVSLKRTSPTPWCRALPTVSFSDEPSPCGGRRATTTWHACG
jgi:hypothetical protein